MTIRTRTYSHPKDFKPVADFLVRHYQPGHRDGNWLQPAWAYMHGHSALDPSTLDRIGLWEDGGEIVAVVHHESEPGEAFFQTHPAHTGLVAEMLVYAETHLYGITEVGGRILRAYVNEFDPQFQALVRSRGYTRAPEHDRPLSRFAIPDPYPEIALPEGYRVKGLEEDNDLVKVDRVLWRGFNHEGEPPPETLEGRKQAQSAPGYRLELNVVVEAPDGSFVSYAGTWFEPVNRYVYVEPVATAPDYRRRGLGRAAVLEGIRRCAALGASVAYVGSDLAFYRAIGFERIHTSQCWTKYLDE